MTENELEALRAQDYVQSNYNGGWPLPLDARLEHGTPLYIWTKKDAERLLEERRRLLEALRSVEWNGEAGFWEEAGCPDCRAGQLKGWEPGDHHEADCKLRAALAYAEAPHE